MDLFDWQQADLSTSTHTEQIHPSLPLSHSPCGISVPLLAMLNTCRTRSTPFKLFNSFLELQFFPMLAQFSICLSFSPCCLFLPISLSFTLCLRPCLCRCLCLGHGLISFCWLGQKLLYFFLLLIPVFCCTLCTLFCLLLAFIIIFKRFLICKFYASSFPLFALSSSSPSSSSYLSLKRLLLKLQLSWEYNGQSLMRIGCSQLAFKSLTAFGQLKSLVVALTYLQVFIFANLVRIIGKQCKEKHQNKENSFIKSE